MGGLLIIYTVSGGARAVAYTQKLQLIIIIIGMAMAGYMVVHLMPANVGFANALRIGGKSGKMNVITNGMTANGFDWKDKYNVWSGVIGGLFLALSYFGTDQSQVGRYLTAKDNKESRLGLLINGLVKVPMQFMILMIGILVFSFYHFNKSPIYFNDVQIASAKTTLKKDSLENLEKQYAFVAADNDIEKTTIRKHYKDVLKRELPAEDVNDTNYIFLRFVIDYLPKGLIGLLIAIIFLAAWGSIAAALNALASCTMIDFHRRYHNPKEIVSEHQSKREYHLSQGYTFTWGIFCIIVAQFAN